MGTDFYEKLEAEAQRREQEALGKLQGLPPAIAVSATEELKNIVAESLDTSELVCLSQGTKFDQDKPRYDLIPPEALDGLARLYGMGAGKYEDRNWEKGMNWSRLFAAMMRHAWKWWRGESYDQEDGQHHLLSVIFCAAALYTYEVRKVAGNDRPPSAVDPQCYETIWRHVPKGPSPKAYN